MLTGDSRYLWTHGIDGLMEDLIEGEGGAGPEWIPRTERVSITYRWLLPGADVVGESE